MAYPGDPEGLHHGVQHLPEEPHGALLVTEVTPMRRKGTGGSRTTGGRPGRSHHVAVEQHDQPSKLPSSPLWQRSMPCRRWRRNDSSQCCEVFRKKGLQGPVYETLGKDGHQGVWRVGASQGWSKKERAFGFQAKGSSKETTCKGWNFSGRGKKKTPTNRGEKQEEEKSGGDDKKDGGDKDDMKDPGGTAALRKKLQELKSRASGAKPVEEEAPKEDGAESPEKEKVESVESSDSESSPAVETPKLSTGTQLAKPTGQLAIMDKPHGSRRFGEDRKRKEARCQEAQGRGRGSTAGLGRAEEQGPGSGETSEARREKEERQRKKGKGIGEGIPQKEPQGEKEKEKEKEEEERNGGGRPLELLLEQQRIRQRWGSSSSLLAPLQKKSKQDPGAVLQLLLKHAKQLMDQDAAVDTTAASGVLGGVRMTSYFSLLLRPYYSTASRDMKELFLLATAIDELRQGRLGALGDSLVSRFIAIQTAMADGSWRSAQFLEMHPLENNSPAPMPLLLQARKHAKVVDRSLRVDDGGRRGNWRGSDPRGQWQQEEKGKGKGGKGKDKGKKGKGKGRDSWGSGGQGGGWNNWNNQYNANQDWWNSKKDGKDGKEGKSKEDQKKEG